MHCPSCGHEQASDSVKFCSRCGFDITLIPELLENLGRLSPTSKYVTRKMIVFLSFTFMMLCIFAAVVLESLAGMHNLAPILAMAGLVTGVLSILAAYFFLPPDSERSAIPSQRQTALPNAVRAELPAQQSIPVDQYIPATDWKAPTTNDLAQPLSVTDNTTKLLEKDI